MINKEIYFIGELKRLPDHLINEKKDLYTTSYLTYKLNKKKINYLFHNKYLSKLKFLEEFSMNWYLDDDDDISFFEEISIGRMYSRRFLRNFSNVLKCFITLNNLNLKKRKIYGVNLDNFFLEILKYYTNKIKILSFDNFINGETFPNRAFFLKNPPKSKKTFMLALIFDFSFFDFLKQNKIIYIDDKFINNSTENFKDILKYRSINPFKNFYFDDSFNKLEKDNFKNNLNKKLKSLFKNNIIKNNFYNSNISKIINYEIYEKIIKEELINNADNIFRSKYIVSKIIKRFNPKKILTYTPNDFLTSIIYDLKKENCSLEIIQDGYFIPFTKSFLFNGKNTIFYDKYYFYNYYQKLILKKLKIKDENLAKIKLKKNKLKKNNIIKIYDLIVFAYYANLYNPMSIHDSSIFIESKIINHFQKFNIKNIAIKVKKGALGNYKSRSKDLYKLFYKEIGHVNIDIIDNDINELLNTKIFIGPISSTLFEMREHRKKLIIYEPTENGIRDNEKKIYENLYDCKIYRFIKEIDLSTNSIRN